jgi:hypothetical protein
MLCAGERENKSFISVKHEKGYAKVHKNRQMHIFYVMQKEKYGFVNSVLITYVFVCLRTVFLLAYLHFFLHIYGVSKKRGQK